MPGATYGRKAILYLLCKSHFCTANHFVHVRLSKNSSARTQLLLHSTVFYESYLLSQHINYFAYPHYRGHQNHPAMDHRGVLTSQLTHYKHENLMVHAPYKRHISPLPPLPHYHTPQFCIAYKYVCVSYKTHLETFPD